MTTADLTAHRLRNLLHYDTATGIFTWLFGTRFAGQPAGHTCGAYNYKRITIGTQTHLAHRLAWLWVYGAWPTHQIDHIDGNTSNNRIQNLRDVDSQTNCQNLLQAKSCSQSGFLGAHWNKKAKRWYAQIRVDGKLLHIGSYLSAEDAHAAYLQMKRKYHRGNTI
jgi:hypothetical protein